MLKRIAILGALLPALSSSAASAHTTATPPVACVGDCDENGVVGIDELVTSVELALNDSGADGCAAADADHNSRVAVNELIAAVRSSVDGCPPQTSFPLGAYFWPDYAYGETGSALADLPGFGLNTVVAFYDYIKPDRNPAEGQPDCHGLVRDAEARGVDFFVGGPRGRELASEDDATIEERLQATVDCVGNSRRYRGWMFDEPELTGYTPALLDRVAGILRRIDPAHRVWVNFHPYATDAQLRALGAGADIFGFDIYPVREQEDHSGPPNRPLEVVGEQTERARQFAPAGAEVRMIVQAFGYSDLPNEGGRGRRPTPEELRFMAYDAVARGTGGLAFFGSHQLRNLIPLDAPVWNLGVRSTARELALIGPRLREDTPLTDLTARPDSVVVRAVRGESDDLVVAVNEASIPIAATLHFGRTVSAAWEVFEERALAVEGSELHDDFTPYGVHVYRVGR